MRNNEDVEERRERERETREEGHREVRSEGKRNSDERLPPPKRENKRHMFIGIYFVCLVLVIHLEIRNPYIFMTYFYFLHHVYSPTLLFEIFSS